MENSTNETNERLNTTCKTPPQPAFRVTSLLSGENLEIEKYMYECMLCNECIGMADIIDEAIDKGSEHYTEVHFGK